MSGISKKMMQAAAGGTGAPNFLVVVSGDDATRGGVSTYDYTDPQNIVLMDHLENSDAPRISYARAAVFDKEDMLVIISAQGNNSSDAYVVDVSDPYNLSLAASTNITTSTYELGYAQEGQRVGLDVVNKQAYFSSPFSPTTGSGAIFRLSYSSTSVSFSNYEDTTIDDPRNIFFDPVNGYIWVDMSDDDSLIRVYDQSLNYIDYAFGVTDAADFFLDFDNNRILVNRGSSSGDTWELYDSIEVSPRPTVISSLDPPFPQVSAARAFSVDTANKQAFVADGYRFAITDYSSDSLSRLSINAPLPTTYQGVSNMGFDPVGNYVVHGGRSLSGATDSKAALVIFDVSSRASPTQLATYSSDDAALSLLGRPVFVDFFVNE